MSNYIEQKFPEIVKDGYKVTSPLTINYNCIAWAAGDDSKWWWPDPTFQYYWPPQAPYDNTLQSFISMFNHFGYVVCDDDSLEMGFEKVAIYINATSVTHAARQLSSGKWTSKLGQAHDIEHTLYGLVGQEYGTVGQIMKRKIKQP